MSRGCTVTLCDSQEHRPLIRMRISPLGFVLSPSHSKSNFIMQEKDTLKLKRFSRALLFQQEQ